MSIQPAPESVPVWDAAAVGALVDSIGVLAEHPGPERHTGSGELDRDRLDRERLAVLGELERLKATITAAQVDLAVAFAASRAEVGAAARTAAAGQGFAAWQAARAVGAGVGEQLALAMRISPWSGAAHLGFATALTSALPGTLAALRTGVLSEVRARLIVREVDAQITADPDALARLGDRELVREVRAVGYRLDPEGALSRGRTRNEQRYVSLRPHPDTMCQLSALLPVAGGVAAYAALTRAADTARASGDPRTRGQVMADQLITALTGQTDAGAVPVEVQVVLTDAALLGTGPGADDPAQIPGYGTVPAGWVRDLLTYEAGTTEFARQAQVWVRALYATPDRSTLTAMSSNRRLFPLGLRRYLITRDGHCRTPWCDAPIRHIDHVADHTRGGPTNERNGQGLCERCNQTKSLPGWHTRTGPPGAAAQQITWTTPLDLTYTAQAPPLLPGTTPGPEAVEPSVLEHAIRDLLAA